MLVHLSKPVTDTTNLYSNYNSNSQENSNSKSKNSKKAVLTSTNYSEFKHQKEIINKNLYDFLNLYLDPGSKKKNVLPKLNNTKSITPVPNKKTLKFGQLKTSSKINETLHKDSEKSIKGIEEKRSSQINSNLVLPKFSSLSIKQLKQAMNNNLQTINLTINSAKTVKILEKISTTQQLKQVIFTNINLENIKLLDKQETFESFIFYLKDFFTSKIIRQEDSKEANNAKEAAKISFLEQINLSPIKDQSFNSNSNLNTLNSNFKTCYSNRIDIDTIEEDVKDNDSRKKKIRFMDLSEKSREYKESDKSFNSISTKNIKEKGESKENLVSNFNSKKEGLESLLKPNLKLKMDKVGGKKYNSGNNNISKIEEVKKEVLTMLNSLYNYQKKEIKEKWKKKIHSEISLDFIIENHFKKFLINKNKENENENYTINDLETENYIVSRVRCILTDIVNDIGEEEDEGERLKRINLEKLNKNNRISKAPTKLEENTNNTNNSLRKKINKTHTLLKKTNTIISSLEVNKYKTKFDKNRTFNNFGIDLNNITTNLIKDSLLPIKLHEKSKSFNLKSTNLQQIAKSFTKKTTISSSFSNNNQIMRDSKERKKKSADKEKNELVGSQERKNGIEEEEKKEKNTSKEKKGNLHSTILKLKPSVKQSKMQISPVFKNIINSIIENKAHFDDMQNKEKIQRKNSNPTKDIADPITESRNAIKRKLSIFKKKISDNDSHNKFKKHKEKHLLNVANSHFESKVNSNLSSYICGKFPLLLKKGHSSSGKSVHDWAERNRKNSENDVIDTIQNILTNSTMKLKIIKH